MRKLYFVVVVCLVAILAAVVIWWHLKPDQKTGSSSAAAGTAKAPAANAPAAPATNEPTDEQLLTQFGWFMAKRFQLTELDFKQNEIDAILRGMTLSLEGKDSPLPMDSAGPRMSSFLQKRMQAARAAAQKVAEAREATYFANLKSRGVASTASGLYYEIIQPGSEKKPGPTDMVTVNYTGRLTDGQVFDTSSTTGKPAVFQVNRLIRGWSEGLQLVGVGGKIKLYVPFSLAYGPASQPKIPAFSTLEFEVELVSASPAPARPAPPPRPTPGNLQSPNRAPVNPAPGAPPPPSRVPANRTPANPATVSPAPASPAPDSGAH